MNSYSTVSIGALRLSGTSKPVRFDREMRKVALADLTGRYSLRGVASRPTLRADMTGLRLTAHLYGNEMVPRRMSRTSLVL